MINRSEYGARCPHCTGINPGSVLEGAGAVDCIHCKRSFTYWIEELPFYCTDDGRSAGGCACAVCKPPAAPLAESPPGDG